jgi:hypothetical protein
VQGECVEGVVVKGRAMNTGTVQVTQLV